MKYVALVYNNPGAFEALSETERNELMAAADAYLKQITESGELRRAGPRGRRQPVLPRRRAAPARAARPTALRRRDGLPPLPGEPGRHRLTGRSLENGSGDDGRLAARDLRSVSGAQTVAVAPSGLLFMGGTNTCPKPWTSSGTAARASRPQSSTWFDSSTGLSSAVSMTLFGDGGGKVSSIRAPLVGAVRVAKALIGWGKMAFDQGYTYRAATVNGEPGIVHYDPAGQVASVEVLEIADGVVTAVRSVLNPDKLARIPAR